VTLGHAGNTQFSSSLKLHRGFHRITSAACRDDVLHRGCNRARETFFSAKGCTCSVTVSPSITLLFRRERERGRNWHIGDLLRFFIKPATRTSALGSAGPEMIPGWPRAIASRASTNRVRLSHDPHARQFPSCREGLLEGLRDLAMVPSWCVRNRLDTARAPLPSP